MDSSPDDKRADQNVLKTCKNSQVSFFQRQHVIIQLHNISQTTHINLNKKIYIKTNGLKRHYSVEYYILTGFYIQGNKQVK